MTDKIIPDPPLKALEASLNKVYELLGCASAVAYETGDCLNGSKRSLIFSAVHLIETAKAELEHSLRRIETLH
jgi:hypothetical protein